MTYEYDPEGEDITTVDYRQFWLNRRCILRVDGDDWNQELNDWMNDNGYFPNVWFISDHGNVELLEVV